MEFVVMLTTVDDHDMALVIARDLIREKLAACVQVLPAMQSVYEWKGEVHEDTEYLLLCKTRSDLCEAFSARLHALHPYEVPELIQLPIQWGSKGYLDWISAQVGLG
jgi:periplasmic divalent cation tolerance protein